MRTPSSEEPQPDKTDTPKPTTAAARPRRTHMAAPKLIPVLETNERMVTGCREGVKRPALRRGRQSGPLLPNPIGVSSCTATCGPRRSRGKRIVYNMLLSLMRKGPSGGFLPFLFFGIMRLEHIAFQVADPVAMADWYVTHLGFSIRCRRDEPTVAQLLGRRPGSILFELSARPRGGARLPRHESHGASPCRRQRRPGGRRPAAGGGRGHARQRPGRKPRRPFRHVRDPWGMPLQLVRRAEPMLE